MKVQLQLLKNTPSAIVLLLIIVSLGLGSCSVKKAIHTLLAAERSQQAPGKGGAAAVCTGWEESLGQDLSLPQPASSWAPPLLPAFFLSGFPDFGIAPGAGKQQAKHSGSRWLLHLKTVPLYLRNRSLLI